MLIASVKLHFCLVCFIEKDSRSNSRADSHPLRPFSRRKRVRRSLSGKTAVYSFCARMPQTLTPGALNVSLTAAQKIRQRRLQTQHLHPHAAGNNSFCRTKHCPELQSFKNKQGLLPPVSRRLSSTRLLTFSTAFRKSKTHGSSGVAAGFSDIRHIPSGTLLTETAEKHGNPLTEAPQKREKINLLLCILIIQ